MREQLFRKSALERLSSPEELDSLIQVTNPKGWIALLALGGLVIVAVAWGLFGSIPVKIISHGVMIRSGRIQEIDATTDGKVAAVYTGRGRSVRKGEVVARMAEPKLLEEITRAKSMLKEAKAVYEKGAQLGLKQKIESQDALIVKLEQEFEQRSRVISRYDGRIREVLVSAGDVIHPGNKIMTIEREGDALEARLFVSPPEGRRILPGMKVLVSPAVAGQEVGGAILGEVTRIAAVTAANREIFQDLLNRKARRGFSSGSSLMEVHVELLRNPADGNGYSWTSSKGRTMKLESNTTCSASVIVDAKPPISMVMPPFGKSSETARESYEGI
jgi:multidrug efflux pump subunit AcrA (membrane-fusion protein)